MDEYAIVKYEGREIPIQKLNLWDKIKFSKETSMMSSKPIFKLSCGNLQWVVKAMQTNDIPKSVFNFRYGLIEIAVQTYFGDKYPDNFMRVYGYDYIPGMKLPKILEDIFYIPGLNPTKSSTNKNIVIYYMELGKFSLKEWLKTPRTRKEYINMVKSVIDTLIILKDEDVEHNDLHLDNILLTYDNKFKVIDFDVTGISLNEEGSDSAYFFKSFYEYVEYKELVKDVSVLKLMKFLHDNRDMDIYKLKNVVDEY